MPLSRFPRINLAHLPTPLEPMDRLSEALGGPRIFVKRDDCTGLATGGNKTRKLEFLLADAIHQGCDTVLTLGGLQSNHARQTAAAAAKMGLKCELFLEAVEGVPEKDYDSNGNMLLDRILGPVIHRFTPGAPLADLMATRAESIRSEGGRPYAIPGGGSNGIGALGYVDCILEIARQSQRQSVTFDYIVLPTGSAGTQAGLLAGLELCGSETRVIGINVSASEKDQKDKLKPVADECFGLLDLAPPQKDQFVCDDRFLTPGYGIPNDGTLDAIRTLARSEALLLDPVYTGKGMAGLIGRVREGYFSKDDTVLFLHTGGSAALFAYESLLRYE